MNTSRSIVVGGLIDGSGAPIRRKVRLSIRAGRIAAIDPADDPPRPEYPQVDDLSHCTITPALVDCSLSLSRSPSLNLTGARMEEARPAEKTGIIERHLGYCLAHGVLGLAVAEDLSGFAESSFAKGTAAGISLRFAAAASPAGAQAGEGSYLRIACSSDIEGWQAQEAPRLSPAALRAIIAGKGDGKAVVLANGRQEVAAALAAGCDAIEQGYEMGEENLEEMARRGVLWIPSVLRAKNALDGSSSGGEVCCRFSLRYVAPGKAVPGEAAFWKEKLAGQLAQLRLARTLGVETATGTGAGSPGILHGEAVAEEIRLFLKAGYTLEDALRSASENGARFFGMEELGALAVGRRATFLVIRGTAGQVPRKLAYLEGIYLGGAPSGAYRKNPLHG